MNHETLAKITLISGAIGEGIKLVTSLASLFSEAPDLTVAEVELEIARIQKLRSELSDQEQARLDAAVSNADD